MRFRRVIDDTVLTFVFLKESFGIGRKITFQRRGLGRRSKPRKQCGSTSSKCSHELPARGEEFGVIHKVFVKDLFNIGYQFNIQSENAAGAVLEYRVEPTVSL